MENQATRRLVGIGLLLGVAVVLGLFLAGVIGAIAPDLVRAIADPFLCSGELVRESERFPFDRPGETTITHSISCVTAAGTDDMTLLSIGVAGLVTGLVLLVAFLAVTSYTRRFGSLPPDQRRTVDRVAGTIVLGSGIVGGGLVAADGMSATPTRAGLVWTGGMILWAAVLLTLLLTRTPDADAADGELRWWGLLRLPLYLVLLTAPGLLTLWFGMVGPADDDPIGNAPVVVGAILSVIGIILAIARVRRLTSPERMRAKLVAMEQKRAEFHRRSAATETGTATSPDQRPGTTAVDDLQQAAELYRSGLLTDDEFASLKARILGPGGPVGGVADR